MRSLPLLVAATVLLLCMGSGAQELRPSFETETIWTDNVFGTTTSEIDDTSVRITPGIEIVEPRGDVSWSLSYKPGFEYSIDDAGLRGWDHDASVALAWRIGPKWTFRIADDFERYRSIARLNQFTTNAGGTTTADFVGSRRRFIRNTLSSSLTYSSDSRNQTTLAAQLLNWDFSDEGRADIEVLAVSVSHTYLFDRNTKLTARVSWRERSNDQELLGIEQDSEFLDLNFQVEHALDPSLTVTVAAGPAYVTGDQTALPPSQLSQMFPLLRDLETGEIFYVSLASCPTLADGTSFVGLGCERAGLPDLPNLFGNPSVTLPITGTIVEPDDSSLSYFANLGVTKKWDRWRLAVNLVRRADDSSSVGSASIENSASVNLSFRVSPVFTLSATGAYSLREQEIEAATFVTTLAPVEASPSPLFSGTFAVRDGIRPTVIDRNDERTSLRFSLRAHWRFTERLTLTATGYWFDEEDERGDFTVRDTQRLTGWLGFQYAFEPIHL